MKKKKSNGSEKAFILTGCLLLLCAAILLTVAALKIKEEKAAFEATVDEALAQCVAGIRSSVVESSVTADRSAGKVIFVKGTGEPVFDEAVLRQNISAAMKNGEEYHWVPQYMPPKCPDFYGLYQQLYAEVADACFLTDGSHEIAAESTGCSFDAAAAIALWQSAGTGEELSVPLNVVAPTVTKAELEERMFRDLLGAVTTKYNNSNENRSSNVRLASSKIDGVVLWPGETFSYNDVVGARTEEAGFLLAPAYAGYGDIKDEWGGGVCQVSTGVYAASLFAFLEITSHTCHIYPPNYIQLGMDATVSIPEGGGRVLDLKVTNNKAWPVKIVSYCEEYTDENNGRPRKNVTVEIWGTLEEDDYMPVEFDNSYADIYDYDRKIAPAYPDREGYKIKFTHDENEFEDDYGKGLRTATHRKVYDSRGNLVEDFIINKTYSAGYALDTYYYKE